MSTSEKIAHAYGVLVARGDKVTVRAVQKQAGVRIGEVAAWMREHATGAAGEVPEAPDLSEPMSAMVASVWAAAWKRAAEQADEATAVALDAARAGEADALAAADESHLAHHVGEPGLAGDTLGDEQPDGVGAAVDGAHAHGTAASRTVGAHCSSIAR